MSHFIFGFGAPKVLLPFAALILRFEIRSKYKSVPYYSIYSGISLGSESGRKSRKAALNAVNEAFKVSHPGRRSIKNTGSMSCTLSRQIYFARLVQRHSHNVLQSGQGQDVRPVLGMLN